MSFIDFVTHNFYFIAAIIGALAFIYATFKIAVNNAAKESNQILRDLNKDKDGKIKSLEDKQQEIMEKLHFLEVEVKHLQKQKMDYEELIIRALKDHFLAHPDMAAELGDAVKRKNKDA